MSDGDFIPPYMKEKVMSEPSKEAFEIARTVFPLTGPLCIKLAEAIDALREKDRAEDKKRIEELEYQRDEIVSGIHQVLVDCTHAGEFGSHEGFIRWLLSHVGKFKMKQVEVAELHQERDRLKAENERLREELRLAEEPRLVVCQIIEDGQRMNDDLVIVQESYGLNSDEIPHEDLVKESVEDAVTPPIPDGAECAIFKLVNFQWNESQVDEFGRVEVPGYWEYETQFVRFEFPSKEALTQRGEDQ